MKCPYGGICIDPGDPGDCEVNSTCFNFKSKQEKADFDALPDKYEVTLGMISVRFKNSTQVEFYLRDCRNRHLAVVRLLGTDDSKEWFFAPATLPDVNQNVLVSFSGGMGIFSLQPDDSGIRLHWVGEGRTLPIANTYWSNLPKSPFT